ncbi:PE-PGRS family protein [Streptomyces sp. NPDC093801]|uniref:PE-PGRS family protein n=1 Tax=Streptomyces sp. NPDC093801 TaxID=3155203 RepID=UPI00344DC407
MADGHDERLRDHDGHAALLAAMGLEPVGTWWVPGVRRAGAARRLLDEAAGAGEAGTGPSRAVRLVLGEGREFLLAFGGPHAPGGCAGRAWHRVRCPAADPVAAVAGLLTAADPDPRGLLLAATDGETVVGVPSGRGAARLLAVTGWTARVEAAAEAAGRETPEEGAAAWAAFADALDAHTARPPSADADAVTAVPDDWRRGLVANPGTPRGVRLDLMRRDPGLMWLLPPDEAVEAALAAGDPKLRLHVAERGCALGPAHWTRLFRAAATERERWMLAFTAVDTRGVLDDGTWAALAADPSARVRAETARLAGLPDRYATALAGDPAPAVRAAACPRAWAALPAERRRALLADGSAGVRIAARLCHHTEVPLSREDFEDFEGGALGERAVRSCLLAPALVDHLLATGEPGLRGALAENPRLTPDAVARLASDADEGVRHVVALRADLTEEQRAAIPVSIAPGSRYGILEWVADLHGDAEAMRRLAASSHVLVRRSVARARRLPPDVVGRLAWDTDRAVQLFLAESCDDAPAEMLLRVWTWWTGSLSSPDRPRSHPNFPRAGLLRYADDPHGRMRRLALDDPLSTPALVARFARDRDPEVRRRAAEDPRLSATDAVRLAQDPDDGIRDLALAHRALPAGVLAARLLDPHTAAAAARNPTVPLPVVHAVAARCGGGAAAVARQPGKEK